MKRCKGKPFCIEAIVKLYVFLYVNGLNHHRSEICRDKKRNGCKRTLLPYLGWIDTNINVSIVGFLALNSFYIYDKFFPVNLNHFADLLTFVVTTNDLYFDEKWKNVKMSRCKKKRIEALGVY